jgi:RNA polymerase sigma-70 factor (ECF subfamily)
MSDMTFGWSLAGWLFGGTDRGPGAREPRSTTPSGDATARPSKGTVDADVFQDTDLIGRIRHNDESALAEAMDLYADDVIAIAFHSVRNMDVANDVAQDVFIRLWERRHDLAVENLAYYLRRAARNAAISVLRQDAVLARTKQAVATEYETVRTHVVNHGMSVVEADELTQRIRTTLATLSPRVQEIALLYHEQAFEPGEIAMLLGVAPQTVYNQLRTAMQALARAFKP